MTVNREDNPEQHMHAEDAAFGVLSAVPPLESADPALDRLSRLRYALTTLAAEDALAKLSRVKEAFSQEQYGLIGFDGFSVTEEVPDQRSHLSLVPEVVTDAVTTMHQETASIAATIDAIFSEAAAAPDNVITLVPEPREAESLPSSIDVLPLPVTHLPATKQRRLFSRSTQAETLKAPRLKLRLATLADIPQIVDVDLRAFGSVYKNYDLQGEELRQDLIEKFSRRLTMIGSEWMPVIESEGKIVGFMTSCPTNKSPQDFKSWEETTDNGTLETTYDPNGKNVYVVTLSVLPEASKDLGQNMLMANQIGNLIKKGYQTSFFESRLPGLHTWVKKQCREAGLVMSELTDDQKQAYADNYFQLKTTDKKGKSVPQDRLIRLYHEVGCKFLKVVPDAYEDKPSMNFGVVCLYENPLPKALIKTPIGHLAGKLLQLGARSPRLTKRFY